MSVEGFRLDYGSLDSKEGGTSSLGNVAIDEIITTLPPIKMGDTNRDNATEEILKDLKFSFDFQVSQQLSKDDQVVDSITGSKGSNGGTSSTSSSSGHVRQLLHLWRYYTTSKISPFELHVVQNIASEICALLLKTKSDEALSVFLNNLPDVLDGQNENIIRARIWVALNKKDTTTVKKLLQENNFRNGKQDLVKIWDQALYLDEERRTGKKLTALTRFRVRKRYPPPLTICSEGVRKTSALPRESTTYLKTWLLNHLQDPYPSALEKQQLAKMSSLSTRQVKTWFANARRRSKSTDEFRKRCEESNTQQMKMSTSFRNVRKGSTSPPVLAASVKNFGQIEAFSFKGSTSPPVLAASVKNFGQIEAFSFMPFTEVPNIPVYNHSNVNSTGDTWRSDEADGATLSHATPLLFHSCSSKVNERNERGGSYHEMEQPLYGNIRQNDLNSFDQQYFQSPSPIMPSTPNRILFNKNHYVYQVPYYCAHAQYFQ